MSKRDPYLVAFGQRLAKLRKSQGLTQEKLAENSDLGSQYISDIERGTVNPSLLVLRNIAGGLGLTLARLFADASETEVEIGAMLEGKSKPERARAVAVLRSHLAPTGEF